MRRLATEDLLQDSGRRLRVRRVAEDTEANIAVLRASKGLSGDPVIHVTHGGGVLDAYSQPAETEGLVTVAWPNGNVYQIGARLRAKKVTLGGVLEACFGKKARAFADERFGLAKKEKARNQIIAMASKGLAELS